MSIDTSMTTQADLRHQAEVAAFAAAERRGEDHEACAAAATAAGEAAAEAWEAAYAAACEADGPDCDGSSEAWGD